MRIQTDGRLYVAQVKVQTSLQDDLYQVILPPIEPGKWYNFLPYETHQLKDPSCFELVWFCLHLARFWRIYAGSPRTCKNWIHCNFDGRETKRPLFNENRLDTCRKKRSKERRVRHNSKITKHLEKYIFSKCKQIIEEPLCFSNAFFLRSHCWS